MPHPLKVLIVDDDSLIREMLRLILLESGLTVCGEANDGATTRRILAENPPNVVLLDIVLPGENGLELLSFIKKEYPEIHVIMVSGEPSSERVQSAIASGARGFIVKPFNAQNVMSAFKRLIPEGS
jgi:two-component system chemotaxis response regulator CheY